MVDLLPGAPADVADPEVARPRPQGEPERVAKPLGDDAPRVRVAVRRQGVVGQSGPRGGVDAEHGPAEERRSRHPVQAEGTQGTPLGGRRRLGSTYGGGRVAARILRRTRIAPRASVLAVVDVVEAGSFSSAHVERAVRAELEIAYGMAGELLAPPPEQGLLAAGHGRVAGGGEASESAADHATIGRRAGRARTRVVPDGSRPAGRRVVGVEDVDVRCRREVRVERQPEQAAIPVVVDLRSEIGEGRGFGVVEPVEYFDHAALLGDEDAPVAREPERGRVVQAADGDGLLEA